MEHYRKQVLEMLLERDVVHEHPGEGFVELASGLRSKFYVDMKSVLSDGGDLTTVCDAIIDLAAERGAVYEAVGGMEFGAVPIAVGIAMVQVRDWFVIRKVAKRHGIGGRLVGAPVKDTTRVLLVEDVATTGASLLEAAEEVRRAGANVVLATAVIDRGDVAARVCKAAGILYEPLLTHELLGIPAVEEEQVT